VLRYAEGFRGRTMKLERAKVLSAEQRRNVLFVRLRYESDGAEVELEASRALAEEFAPCKWVGVVRQTKRAGRRSKNTLTDVKRAIRKLGEGATQKTVAEALGVDASTPAVCKPAASLTSASHVKDAYNLSDDE
jgi:hypothetical protein